MRHRPIYIAGHLLGVSVCLAMLLFGCAVVVPVDADTEPVGAPSYVGKAACLSCHADLVETHRLHGHNNVLTDPGGQAPTYPVEAAFAGVDEPPPGRSWDDVAYVLGGYTKGAAIVDQDGYLLVRDDGTDRALIYQTMFYAAGAIEGYTVSYAEHVEESVWSFSCLRCHVTGALDVDDSGGRRQDGRVGIAGTWSEDGVQCEACHGPGSVHIGDPDKGHIDIDASCTACHGWPDDPANLAVVDGLLVGYQQVGELLAGPHAEFACTVCHDPHTSVLVDGQGGLRNTCLDCHPDATMAGHDGAIFAQGDYVEELDCISCHMPLASRNVLQAPDSFLSKSEARTGDTRTHIFAIDVMPRGFDEILEPDGTGVALGEDGKTAITVDFACLRCHNGLGSALLFTIDTVVEHAENVHEKTYEDLVQ